MWKAALAGALVFAAAGVCPASAAEKSPRAGQAVGAHADPAIEAKIAQAKAMLQLRPDQERHWPRIAAAVRMWANMPAADEAAGEDESLVRRASSRAAALSSRALRAQRVLSAAMPLVRTLDPEQRQAALTLVRAMGLGHLAAAL